MASQLLSSTKGAETRCSRGKGKDLSGSADSHQTSVVSSEQKEGVKRVNPALIAQTTHMKQS